MLFQLSHQFLGIKVHCTGGCHKQCACFPFTIGKVSGSLFVEGKGVLHVVDSHVFLGEVPVIVLFAVIGNTV